MSLTTTLRRLVVRLVRPCPRGRRAEMWASVYRETHGVRPRADGGERD